MKNDPHSSPEQKTEKSLKKKSLMGAFTFSLYHSALGIMTSHLTSGAYKVTYILLDIMMECVQCRFVNSKAKWDSCDESILYLFLCLITSTIKNSFPVFWDLWILLPVARLCPRWKSKMKEFFSIRYLLPFPSSN